MGFRGLSREEVANVPLPKNVAPLKTVTEKSVFPIGAWRIHSNLDHASHRPPWKTVVVLSDPEEDGHPGFGFLFAQGNDASVEALIDISQYSAETATFRTTT